jgi:hypothetical protein
LSANRNRSNQGERGVLENNTQGSNRSAPRVRRGTLINDDTGETTILYFHSKEEVDAEIDRYIRGDRGDSAAVARHEARRAKLHLALDAA